MRVLLLALLLTTASTLSAQISFQKNLPVFLDSALIRCTPDGAFVYLAGTVVQNGQTRLHLLKMDASGNLLWHLQYLSYNPALRLNDALPVSDGLVVTITSGQNTAASDGFVQKFDADGQLVWGKRIGLPGRTRVFELEKDGLENIFLTGLALPDQQMTDPGFYFLAYLQPGGTVLKSVKSRHHYFPNSTDEIYQLTNLNWNPTAGELVMIEDFTGLYTASYISALNRGTWSLGHTDESLEPSENIWNVRFQSIQSTANRVAFSGRTIFTSDNVAMGLLDAAGNTMTVLKSTPYLLQPVHSYNDDIFFYDPHDKTLTQYDDALAPIWSRRFDNCNETTAFDAEVAFDGVIFTVRNISGRTIVSKILPGGSLPDCPGFVAQPTPAQTIPYEAVGDIDAMGQVLAPLLTADSALHFTLQPSVLNDFCIPMYAAFVIPDTVCLGADIPLTGVDTSAGVSHSWMYAAASSHAVQPEISFPGSGLFQVTHTLSNLFCTDTASRLIQVLQPPVLQLKDTLVCGPATFFIDLSDPAATAYWLDGVSVAPQVALSETGTYTFRIANAACSDEQTIQVKIVGFPWPLAEPDTTLCGGVAYPLLFAPGFENILWDSQLHPDTFLITDGALHTYTATYSADPACVIRGAVQIPRRSCDSDLLYVPNSFSPNDDGANDFFYISPTADAELLQYSVYDRWGACLFQSSPSQEHWDGMFRGAKLPPGVYVYWIQLRNKLTDEVQIRTGELTLFR